MYQAKVYITLKESILDPQGTAVKGALENLKYQNIPELRIGKYIQLQIDETDLSRAESQLKEMCEKILSNPIIENYSYDLSEG